MLQPVGSSRWLVLETSDVQSNDIGGLDPTRNSGCRPIAWGLPYNGRGGRRYLSNRPRDHEERGPKHALSTVRAYCCGWLVALSEGYPPQQSLGFRIPDTALTARFAVWPRWFGAWGYSRTPINYRNRPGPVTLPPPGGTLRDRSNADWVIGWSLSCSNDRWLSWHWVVDWVRSFGCSNWSSCH